MPNDITFEQLNTASNNDSDIGADICSITGDLITIDVKALTGKTFTGLTDAGVLQMMFRLRKLAGDAQALANDGVPDDEQLNSFPPFSYAPPTPEGIININQVQDMVIKISTANITGIN